jgi:ligand-binding sensor domain-containing protein
MLNWIKYLLILPFLLNSVLNFGQNQKMLKQFLTVEEGLSHNEVTSIVQDNDGFIWIGTKSGVVMLRAILLCRAKAICHCPPKRLRLPNC